jgi:pimeloyl-ACP methyl ester carboxylesterase
MTSTPTPAAPAATDLAPPVVGHVRPRRLRRRVAAYAGLAWLRTVFGVLQVVAPDAADRKALDVWCTLPPGARRRAHDHRPGGGEVVRLATARGGDAVAEVWGEGPVVLLVHGWGGWRGQLGRFVAPLVDAGHRVVAVDAPGHGDAGAGFMGPGRGTLFEISDALHAAQERFAPDGVAAVVAHSLGTTATAHAVREGLPADRLALVSPNPGFGPLLEAFSRAFGLNARTTAHLRQALEGFTDRTLEEFDLPAMGAGGDMPPTLVVHDEADREAPYAVGAAVAAAWPTATLVTTRGLGHYRLLADDAVVRAVVGHVTGA